MNNYDIAHKFFYSEKRECNPSYKAMSFINNKFYSYSTLIGLIATTKKKEQFLLVSEDSMSNTTGKHIGYLISACPFGYKNIIRVPFRYGESLSWYEQDMIISHVLETALDRFNYTETQTKLTQKTNREYLTEEYQVICKLVDLFKIENKDVLKKAKKLIKTKKQFIDDLNNNDKVKALKSKERAKNAEHLKQVKAEMKKLTEKTPITELARQCYSYYSDLDIEIKKKIAKVLNPNSPYEFAYCWVDGDLIKTSKSCSVDVEEAKTLLKLWKHNKLKHGMTIGCYTVLQVMNNYLQIGCHKIPVENVEQLYKELVGA